MIDVIIISSQRYINWDKVEEKKEALQDATAVSLPIVYAGEFNGDQLYILVDGHHTREAAIELGVEVQYDEQDRNALGYNDEWTLDEMLEHAWVDSDWYNVETGYDYF